MKNRIFKNSLAALFMGIFVIKMVISTASVFVCIDNKTVHAVIMQLEHESKNEKEDPEKESVKEKKVFDESINHLVVYRPFIVETNILHNLEKSLYKQVYHPTVPTPPPNV
ncbi:hypothetical protein [Mucilaginibacter sp. AK015]|uniref:hypothetical protein n=1 Tax=Mucilaginibacter sp. AK015 TaxID=2723072 RepID=UPI00160CC875|nr:hypothetical protein [Mucilaginibacter sp. AK015]MBB5395880.1 hypothetical protein [Mucilaginibacter sp. AK015]